jgi:hypothetical protein
MAFNPLSPEWPKQTADQIDRFTQKIKDAFTNKAVTAVNGVVYGMVCVFTCLVALVMMVVVAVRTMQAYLTWDLDTVALWVIGVIALLGVLLVVGGLVRTTWPAVGLGAILVVIAGARWALDMGEVGIDHDTSVWLSYLIVGGTTALLGAFIMGQRHAPDES